MQSKLYTLKITVLLVLLATFTTNAQIAVNNSPNTSTCNLNGNNVSVSVPTEALTGDNIALNITLPGSYAANCVKKVTITTSSNLQFQSSGAIPFSSVSTNVYENTSPPVLAGNDGQNFNVFFKFPGYTTCNGTVGTFTVDVELDCDGVITTCSTSVNVIARAANYWTITKEFYTGDLTCGVSTWKIKLNHNNPNGAGLGTYKLSGTITETPSVPIVSGATHTVNYNLYYNGTITKYVKLQNCSPSGSTITNTANYNFTLGDGTCDNMTGTISATSPPLASPNASLSFNKSVSNPYTTNLTPGCDARYWISVCNNGNVPWTDIVITDNLNIPGITITNISLPSGWTSSPAIPPFSNTNYTFTAPSGFMLNPGECAYIYINFTIDTGATIGSTITNTASISYVASGVGSTSGNSNTTPPCTGISCPTIDTTIQNTSDSVSFVVEEPKAIPSIKKCIVDPPNTLIPPIYQIGDIIKFSVMIGNSGAGDLSTVVTDAFTMPSQNLEIIPSSITYNFYTDENSGNKNSCNPNFSNLTPISSPFSVVADTTDLQNPQWTITDMPGTCELYKSNFLVIEFEAEILPQIHGTKTNTASLTTSTGALNSSVNYSIDQVGILAIHKEADAEIVENSQSFNYIITVSNNGSVPLDNIIITDDLPDCINRNGQITIEDSFGTSITSSSSGNVIITVNPATQLQPGDYFTITIPVKKSGSGNCCNESVSVTAEMITSNVELNANFGDETAPAACVTSTECCDIDNFEATLNENNGTYSVTINGGSIPLQEVEIAMVDYHIEYANEDCKPDNLGIFGTLNTTTTNLGNLILNSSDNGTSILTWQLGNPSIINNIVTLDIVNPEVLNLDCCEVEFYFCLKVKAKDVDCNVCEKIICFSSDDINHDEPCDLEITDFTQGEKYCAGDTITLNWTGTATSGMVNIILFDNTNATTYQVLATNVPNTGSYTYTIPTNIPCNPPRSWSLLVEDAEKECFARSNPFVIECCDQTLDCDCGEWLTKTVAIKTVYKDAPTHTQSEVKRQLKYNTQIGSQVSCGEKIELKRNVLYNFTAPTYVCNPENCEVEYKWEIIYSGNVIQSGVGKTFSQSFASSGNYKIKLTPICGGVRCEPCVIQVNIAKPVINHNDMDTYKY